MNWWMLYPLIGLAIGFGLDWGRTSWLVDTDEDGPDCKIWSADEETDRQDGGGAELALV